jgi:hypothetical protein
MVRNEGAEIMLRLMWPTTSDTPLPAMQGLLAILGLSLLSWAIFITVGIRLASFLINTDCP